MIIIKNFNEDKIRKLFIAYSISVSILFFTVMIIYTGFKLSAPLDDAFIYFQYAKNFVNGHFFEYVKGEGYSSGATSVLYAIILIPFAFFLRGSVIIVVSYLIGGICLFISGYYIYKILKKLNVENLFSIFGGFFFITNGNVLWGYFSGMEIPVFATLIIVTLYYILSEAIKEQIIFLSLLSVVRPEGFFLVLFFLIIKFFNLFFNKKQNKNILIFILSLFPGIIYFVINKIFTGDFMPNTMRAKSDFSLYYPVWTEILRNGLQKYFNFLLNIYNGRQEHWFFHYSFYIFLIGIAAGVGQEIISRKLNFFSVSFIWFFLGTMLTVFSSFFSVHNYRYAMPFITIFIIIFIYGVFYLFSSLHFKIKSVRNIFYFSVIFLFLFFNFYTILANIINFGRDCKAIYNQSIAAGKWIKKNLPSNAKIAINDIGAITFYSDAKIYDLVGLVTNGQAKIFRNGIAGVYEKIEKIKPDYFMIHLGWFNYERFSFFGLSDKRLVTFNLDLEPPYYVIGSPEVCVPLKTELLNSGDNIQNDSLKDNFQIVDKIDVCDLSSEEKHNYKIWTYFPPDVPGTMLEETKDKYSGLVLIDGGRETIGGEKFVINNLIPGSDLKIIRRTFNPEENRLKVIINSKDVGIWPQAKDNGFIEVAYNVPGNFIESTSAVVEIKEFNKRKYNSFYYWFLQRRNK